MRFHIRAAHDRELAAVGDVTASAYTGDGLLDPGSPYEASLRDAADRAERAELWVAVDESGRVVGTVTFCPPGSAYRELAGEGEGEFRMLAVAPGARRSGVAQALVERCLARSRELGERSVVICSLPRMEAAHRLYGRLGFHRTPERDWSPVPGVDLIAFVRDL